MVLGANEQVNQPIANRASGVSERGLEMACGQYPNAISEACVRLIVKGGDCR
jgi:hypothetical protein